ncbi:MAG: cytochrome c oxidase assembly protein [Gaiellaceae bacterium]
MVAHATLTSWTLDPLQLAPLALGTLAYEWRARTLSRRGQPVPAWRRGLFWIAVTLLAVALVTPLAELAEEDLFVAHMVQHVLLSDLVALALVASLTGPLLRPALALRPVAPLRVLAHPLVALPLWTLNLYIWHVPYLYEAAVRHEAVHALQHVSFLTAGALMWAPVVEVLPGPMWFGTGAKLGYIVAVRLIETVLANVFLWSGTVFYDVYARDEAAHGVSALRDQGLAGTVMMLEGSLVTLGALAWLFLRLAAEGEQRQELIERGLDPQAVRRAVRYGRADELADGG